MSIKIMIDKSVLLSGSIHASIEELGHPFKHPFYEISARLLNKIEGKKDLGYITNEIKEKCRKLLEKAIKDTIKGSDELDLEDMESYYSLSSVCNQKIEERIQSCNSIEVKEDYKDHEGDILRMYIDLKQRVDRISKRQRKEGKRRVEATGTYIEESTFQKIIESQKDPALDTLKRKLIKSLPGFEDIRILAETIHLNETRFDENDVFLSSCDQHFVKVRRVKESEYNDLVPKTIEEEFDIKCMWPDQLSKEYLE